MGDTQNPFDDTDPKDPGGAGRPAAAEDAAPKAEQADQSTDDGPGEHSLEDMHLMLEDARAKVDEHQNELLRARAEQDNMRKRAARDVENARKFALEGFVKELLPVKDSLELGLSAAKEVEGGHAKVLEGMDLTLKMLSAAMEKFNVQEINPVDQPFDPELHQAMATQPSDTLEPNTVITVYQKGYLLNDRLVRPAMVVVSKA